MAGRGGPKLKEYRQHITSVRHWLKEIEYEGLIITEVYCGAFGNCQVILPTINSVMLGVDDSEDKMKWLVINVAKLEEEQRHLLAEEEKKKAEMESVQRRKALNDKDGDGSGDSADGNTNSSLVASRLDDGGDDTAAKIKTAWDKITIPKLEKYTGYDHPRPLWLLMKDGQVLYELNSANPPKLTKLVTSVLSNTPVSEKELADMDFHSDPASAAAKKRRKKKPSKKSAAEAAAAAARQRRADRLAAKVEVVRPEEWLIQARISDIKKSATDTSGKHPLLVCYMKDDTSDEFVYYGQTERIRGDLHPVYHKTFGFLKEDFAPMLENGHHVELKFVLYDSDTDTVSKEHQPTILGDAYIHLKQLLGENGEGGEMEVKLKKHVPHPPSEKKSTKKGKEEPKPEEDEDDHGAGLLTLIAKSRASEGIVTNYKLNLSSRFLPSLNVDQVGVAEVQPETLNPDGTEVDPALVAEQSRRDYFIEFQLSDANTLRPASVGITEVVRGEASPRFATPFVAAQHSRDDRTLTFHLYDGLAVDERFFDGLTNGLAYRKELVATASIRFDAFLLQRRQFKNLTSLPWLDAEGRQLGGGLATLDLTADELNDDGTIEAFDPDEFALDALEAPPEKLELGLTLNGLERDPDAQFSTKQPIVSVFVQTTSGSWEFLGQTERAPPANEDGVVTAAYRKTFLLAVPKPAADIAAAAAAQSEEISADSSYAAFSNPSPVSTPRPETLRTNTYRFVLWDGEQGENYAQGTADELGSSTIELSKELLALGSRHTLALVDRVGGVVPGAELVVNAVEVGAVSTLDLALSAGGLLKVDSNPSALPNPRIRVYASHRALAASSAPLALAGETETLLASTEPAFLGKVQVSSFTGYASHLTVVVYDAPADAPPAALGVEDALDDKHIIGEVSFTLSDFTARSASSAAQSASGQPQPVEYRLARLVRNEEDPTAAPTRVDVNEGAAFVRLCDITPKPPKKRAKRLNDDGEEIDDEEPAAVPEIETGLAAAAIAAATAAAAAGANSPAGAAVNADDAAKAEREAGTCPPVADGSQLSLGLSARAIPKSDWSNDRAVLVALFAKTPVSGLFEYVAHSERVRDEADPVFARSFVVPLPALSEKPGAQQLYKAILLDAPRDLTPSEAAVWAGAATLSRVGVPAERFGDLVATGGEADHLGEVTFDLGVILRGDGSVPTLRLQDRFGVDASSGTLEVVASELGVPTPLQVLVSAQGLPKSTLFNKTDPLVLLRVRDATGASATAAALVEVARSERRVNEASPTWATPLAVDGYSKADRELRFAVYDSDADQTDFDASSERDLLGEAITTVSALLSEAEVVLTLEKDGAPVIVTTGDASAPATLTLRTSVRGPTAVASASRPPTRPGSAVRQPSTTAAAAAAAAAAKSASASAAASRVGSPKASRPTSARVPTRPASGVKSSRPPSRPASPTKSSRPASPTKSRPQSGVRQPAPAATAAEPTASAKSSRPQSAVRQPSNTGAAPAAAAAPVATEAPVAAKSRPQSALKQSRPQSAVRQQSGVQFAADTTPEPAAVAAETSPAASGSRPPSAGAAAPASASASRPASAGGAAEPTNSASRPVSASQKDASPEAEAEAAASEEPAPVEPTTEQPAAADEPEQAAAEPEAAATEAAAEAASEAAEEAAAEEAAADAPAEEEAAAAE